MASMETSFNASSTSPSTILIAAFKGATAARALCAMVLMLFFNCPCRVYRQIAMVCQITGAKTFARQRTNRCIMADTVARIPIVFRNQGSNGRVVCEASKLLKKRHGFGKPPYWPTNSPDRNKPTRQTVGVEWPLADAAPRRDPRCVSQFGGQSG